MHIIDIVGIYIYNHIDLFSIVYKQSDCSYIICDVIKLLIYTTLVY